VRSSGRTAWWRALAGCAAAAVVAAPAGCSTQADVRSAAADAQHTRHQGHDQGHGQGHTARAGAEPKAAGSHAPAQGTVIQPGAPGEQAETLPPDATLPASRHNGADVEFVQMMIPHHAQALEMGELARTRAGDRGVQAMAQRIADAQGAEIVGMSAWLERHGVEAPTAEDLQHQAHHGGTMPGMLTPAQMDRLAAADGRRFDELFLRYMIQHHQGAVDMAGTVMDDGRDIVVGELAADIAAGQNAEINRMRTMLRRL
jgi:uncharacterized protein (DUF305 family)